MKESHCSQVHQAGESEEAHDDEHPSSILVRNSTTKFAAHQHSRLASQGQTSFLPISTHSSSSSYPEADHTSTSSLQMSADFDFITGATTNGSQDGNREPCGAAAKTQSQSFYSAVEDVSASSLHLSGLSLTEIDEIFPDQMTIELPPSPDGGDGPTNDDTQNVDRDNLDRRSSLTRHCSEPVSYWGSTDEETGKVALHKNFHNSCAGGSPSRRTASMAAPMFGARRLREGQKIKPTYQQEEGSLQAMSMSIRSLPRELEFLPFED